MSIQSAVQYLAAHAEVFLGTLAGLLAILNLLLTRRVIRLQARARQARSAAEEAARAAAMAAPGGIDPEAVIDVLRKGMPPTLDNVYAAMQLKTQRSGSVEPATGLSPR